MAYVAAGSPRLGIKMASRPDSHPETRRLGRGVGLTHRVVFGEHCRDPLRIIQDHVVARPDYLEPGVVSEEGLEHVLFVPVEAVLLEIDARVRLRQTDVVDMDEHARREAGQHLAILKLHVVPLAHHVRRVYEQDVVRLKRREYVEVEVLHLALQQLGKARQVLLQDGRRERINRRKAHHPAILHPVALAGRRRDERRVTRPYLHDSSWPEVAYESVVHVRVHRHEASVDEVEPRRLARGVKREGLAELFHAVGEDVAQQGEHALVVRVNADHLGSPPPEGVAQLRRIGDRQIEVFLEQVEVVALEDLIRGLVKPVPADPGRGEPDPAEDQRFHAPV